jgi:hypothetical protein
VRYIGEPERSRIRCLVQHMRREPPRDCIRFLRGLGDLDLETKSIRLVYHRSLIEGAFLLPPLDKGRAGAMH